MDNISVSGFYFTIEIISKFWKCLWIISLFVWYDFFNRIPM